MIGSVIKQEDTQWIPPVDTVLEMHSGTSPAAIYPDTVWTQLKNCIIIAAGDIFKAGETGGQARFRLRQVISQLTPTPGALLRMAHTPIRCRLYSKELGFRPWAYGIPQ